MDNRDFNSNNWEDPRHRGSSGKVMAGLLLVGIGVVVLASKMHFLFLPRWFFSWQMFMIGLGLFIGFKHNFRKPGWLVLVLIGSLFLLDELVAGFNLRFYFWPILLIGLGLWVMLKPKKYYPRRMQRTYAPKQPINDFTGEGTTGEATYENEEGFSLLGHDSSTEDFVDATAILGGVKKTVISKNFKGGEVVSVFGGTELNLSQADMQQPVVLETTQVFGGTTLIVPAHWQIKSEAVAILGGIDDKRPVMPGGYDPNKVLILKGFTMFGGLQIKSY